MAQGTGIEWTRGDDGTAGATWNPVSGCTRASAGCDHCYAVKQTYRLEKMGQVKKYGGLTVLNPRGERHFNGVVRCDESALTIPLRWKKHRRIFVNSMSDLFHKEVPFDFIDRVFAVMALCPQHTFQVLTKRTERMAEYLPGVGNRIYRQITRWLDEGADGFLTSTQWDTAHNLAGRSVAGEVIDIMAWRTPLLNVWAGTSTENQQAADERIPHLLRCPAAVRFISAEPLLGGIKMSPHLSRSPILPDVDPGFDGIDWVIVGGESGPGARHCQVEWVRSIVHQCKEAGVKVFVKQGGAQLTGNYYDKGLRNWYEKHNWEWPDPIGWNERDGQPMLDSRVRIETKNRKGGDLSELPPSMRIRQMPAVQL